MSVSCWVDFFAPSLIFLPCKIAPKKTALGKKVQTVSTKKSNAKEIVADFVEDFSLEPTDDFFVDTLNAGIADGTIAQIDADFDEDDPYEETDDDGKPRAMVVDVRLKMNIQTSVFWVQLLRHLSFARRLRRRPSKLQFASSKSTSTMDRQRAASR